MASILGVQTLQHTNGTTAATVTSSGKLGVATLAHTNGTTAATIDTAGRILQPTKPAFLARRNDTATSLSVGDVFSFDSVSVYGGFDTASGYNTTNKAYTCPVAGLYWFHVSAIIGGATYSNAQWKIQLNGSDYEQRHFSSTNSDYYTHSIDTYINASANDIVRVQAGTALTFYGNQWSVFMGHLVG